MPKLKDILTEDELAEINRLSQDMQLSNTVEEANYYRDEIVKIMNAAKKRYYGYLKPANNEKKTVSMV